MTTSSAKKKNQNLAALLSDDADEIEKGITGGAGGKPEKKEGEKPENSGGGNEKGPVAEIKPTTEVKHVILESEAEQEPPRKEEPKMALEDELGLPKTFTRVFKKNGRYEKEKKTPTLVYDPILSKYKTLSEKMKVDNLVLVNNVLTEWYNKNLEVIDKVVNRKEDVKAL